MCKVCDRAESEYIDLWDRYHGEADTGKRISLRAALKRAEWDVARIKRWQHGTPLPDHLTPEPTLPSAHRGAAEGRS